RIGYWGVPRNGGSASWRLLSLPIAFGGRGRDQRQLALRVIQRSIASAGIAGAAKFACRLEKRTGNGPAIRQRALENPDNLLKRLVARLGFESTNLRFQANQGQPHYGNGTKCSALSWLSYRRQVSQ